MNAYQAGLLSTYAPRRSSAYHRGASVVVGMRLVNSPGYLLDEIERLDGEVAATGADLERFLATNSCPYESNGLQPPLDHSRDPPACVPLYAFWSGPWMEFKAKWVEFRDSHNAGGLTGLYQRFWGSLAETIDAYRAQLSGLQAAAAKAGFGLTVPPPVASSRGYADQLADAPRDLFSGLAGLVKLLVYGALGIGAALLLVMLLRGGSVGGGKLLMVKG